MFYWSVIVVLSALLYHWPHLHSPALPNLQSILKVARLSLETGTMASAPLEFLVVPPASKHTATVIFIHVGIIIERIRCLLLL